MNWAVTTDSLLILNDLIRAHGKTSACYRRAAAQSNDTSEQARLTQIAAQRLDFAEELLERVSHLGGQFAVRVSVDLTDDSGAEEENDPLATAAQIESRTRIRYEEALAEPVDVETHRLLQAQHRGLRRRAA